VLGAFTQPGAPFMIDGDRPASAPAPLLGQHNHEVLCNELGLSGADLAALVAEKVV
jgi:crotonobetainyl-CoA:carnitine CoA-transferase CaiB-like acyl-CoA transferase